jgi:diguanylate cyclase (GGDEF)-like protein
MQYYMNYFTLFMVPLAAMLYFEDIVPTLKMGWLFYSFVILEIVLSVLHFTGIAMYTETVKVFIIFIGVFMVYSMFMAVKLIKLIDPINRIGIMIFLGFSLVNAVFFMFVSTVGDQTFFVRIGFITYLVFEFVNGIRKIMNEVSLEREDQLLQILAYTDQLTGLGNRYALERDAGIIPLEEMSVVSMDLNLLKPTNDSFGHLGGDTLLRSAAKCMSTVFANVYRVGGDEFIALLKDKSEDELKSLHSELHELMDRMNSERDEYGDFAYEEGFALSIAIGHSTYREGDESYEQILSRADQAMYAEKKRMHTTENNEIL